MPKRPRRDLLADHQEWVDHMYNSPYGINRVSLAQRSWWRYTRRHPRLVGAGYGLTGCLLLAEALQQPWGWMTLPPLLLGGVVLIGGVVLFVRAPEPSPSGRDEHSSRKLAARGRRRRQP